MVVEESEEQADLRASGFLPEPTRNTHSQGARWPARRTTAGRGGADEERGSPRSVSAPTVTLILTIFSLDPEFQRSSADVSVEYIHHPAGRLWAFTLRTADPRVSPLGGAIQAGIRPEQHGEQPPAQ